MRALRPCAESGCPTLVGSGRCTQHVTAPRGKVHNRLAYNSTRWRKLREQVLNEEPICMCPMHLGRDDAPMSTVVDHITPHRGSEALFYDRSNLRGLAARCHNRLTAKYDGGFGNPTKDKPR